MELEFRCRDVGVVCSAKLTASSEEELLAKIADHADRRHGVASLTDTLVNYAKSTVRVTGADSAGDAAE